MVWKATVLGLLVIIVVCWVLWGRRPTLRSVAIVVLGDVGRSPRMMYHAQSFASIDFETYIVGYQGSKPIPSLLSIPHVHFLHLSQFPSSLHFIPFVLSAPFKILHQICTLISALLIKMPNPPEFLLVQNPPSIPTLAIAWAISQLTGSKLIIDWHNLGYSVLALKLGANHLLVKVAKRFEAYFGRNAYAHMFVTKAMKDHLVRDWSLQGLPVVLHDRPPRHFHPATPAESHELFLNLLTLLPPTITSFLPAADPPHSTPFTKVSLSPPPSDTLLDEYLVIKRYDRPALIVSSTSWTADEDFGLLFQALDLYEERAKALPGRLPKLLVIVTGKGPLKKRYMAHIDEMQRDWRSVRCVSLWLRAEDYPLLLGSADLGVCLHSSSSGLDLPMKVVDMFGCGLPVCALNYSCLDELVKNGVNGFMFNDAKQLTEHLQTLLTSFPDAPALAKLRYSLVAASKSTGSRMSLPSGEEAEWNTWEDNWNHVVKPLILSDEGRNHSASIRS